MRISVVLLTLGAVGGMLLQGAWSPLSADPAERHSGIVSKVDPRAGMLVLEEMAAAGKARQLQVRMLSNARLVLSERIPAAQVTDLRNPFRDKSIGLSEIQPGDFVVVELTKNGEKAEASSVTVTLRGRMR